jgi:hypothetical protein
MTSFRLRMVKQWMDGEVLEVFDKILTTPRRSTGLMTHISLHVTYDTYVYMQNGVLGHPKK